MGKWFMVNVNAFYYDSTAIIYIRQTVNTQRAREEKSKTTNATGGICELFTHSLQN